MEAWIEALLAGLGWEILSWIVGFVVATVIGFLCHRKPIREMC